MTLRRIPVLRVTVHEYDVEVRILREYGSQPLVYFSSNAR